jgi:hypothetical protein
VSQSSDRWKLEQGGVGVRMVLTSVSYSRPQFLTKVSENPRKLANFNENYSISVSFGPTEVFRITVV